MPMQPPYPTQPLHPPEPNVAARAAVPLIDLLHGNGPLATLFHRVAKEQKEAAGRILGRRPGKASLLKLAQNARRRLQEETAQSPLAASRQCGAGCTACCKSTAVDVTPLEALALADSLKKQLSPDELNSLANRLGENVRGKQDANAPQAPSNRPPCALLDDDGRCIAYAERPLACAGAFSFSRAACDRAAAGAAAALLMIPLDRPAKVWAMGISGGLQRALVEAGLDGNLYERDSILLRAITAPRAACRYLRGEDVFEGCVCTDAHSPPRKRSSTVRIDTPSRPAPKMLKRRRPRTKAAARDKRRGPAG